MSLHYHTTPDAEAFLLVSAVKTADFIGDAVDLGPLAQGSCVFINITDVSGVEAIMDLTVEASNDATFAASESWSLGDLATVGQHHLGVSGDYRYWRLSGDMDGATPSFTLESWVVAA